jgi:cell division protein FtsZ
MTLFEADMAVNAIKKEVDSNANIIFGSAFNENMKGKIRISVVATGIDVEEFKRDSLKASENFEPSRFKISFDESAPRKKEQSIVSAAKSFFDPGASARVANEDVEEISDINFKPKRSYLKEPNQNYGKTEEVAEKKHNFFDEEISNQPDFSDESEEVMLGTFGDQEINLKIAEEKIAIKKPLNADKPSKSSHKPAKPSKKESGGFSLFSFMNSSKASEEKDHDYEEEEVEETKPREVTKKVATTSANAEIHPEKKSQDIEKKRREFFSSTIFDEEESGDSDKIDDDILNVPAFFRRKK